MRRGNFKVLPPIDIISDYKVYFCCINRINTVEKGAACVILIDYKDRRPIYEQVVEKFQQMIICGVMEADSPMPSVRNLAMELSLNPNTIQRAYQELEREGYIYTIKGKGSFVSESSQAADSKREEIKRELGECVNKALSIGIHPQQLEVMLQDCINDSVKGGNTI